jgi:uncharacterized protein (DUF1800 family)
VPAAPRDWLARQLDGPDPALATPGQTIEAAAAAFRAQRDNKNEPAKGNPVQEYFRAGVATAFDILLATDTPFRERLVWFWLNHFTVSVRGGNGVTAFVGTYLRDAIRPHVTGRFADMLRAVIRHPAMLAYLNNAISFGPNSPAGQRQKRGLNENLARECLELHTITPASGYTQADVTSFARILTGWSIATDKEPQGFIFRPNAHEPGSKTLMGMTFPQGELGGEQALAWLAGHPATMRSLATKLVRHFVADTPPPRAVATIEAVLTRTHGDLKAASLALLDLPEAWTPQTKMRTPFDYLTAVIRAVDPPSPLWEVFRPGANYVLTNLGQGIHNAPFPIGWPDTAAEWAAPEAMLRRVDWAFSISARLNALDPVATADNALGPLLPPATRDQIARAGSHREAMTLLLASPQFQRR